MMADFPGGKREEIWERGRVKFHKVSVDDRLKRYTNDLTGRKADVPVLVSYMVWKIPGCTMALFKRIQHCGSRTYRGWCETAVSGKQYPHTLIKECDFMIIKLPTGCLCAIFIEEVVLVLKW